MTALYALAEHCNNGNLKQESICDHLVVGLRDTCLSERLHLDGNLTLEKVVAMARQTETVRQQQNNLRGENHAETCSVDWVEWRKYMPRTKHTQKYPKQTVNEKGLDKSPKCETRPNHHESQCPAKNVTCFSCRERAHFKSMCIMNAVYEVNELGNSVFLGVCYSRWRPMDG